MRSGPAPGRPGVAASERPSAEPSPRPEWSCPAWPNVERPTGTEATWPIVLPLAPVTSLHGMDVHGLLPARRGARPVALLPAVPAEIAANMLRVLHREKWR